MKPVIALLVGRFQPFHLGHLRLIQTLEKRENLGKLIIGIGSAQFKNTPENPFSFDERKEMITKSLNISINYKIVKIPE